MKVFLDTIGCRLNQAEIENIARQFRAAGHEIVASAQEADLAIVNTCTVTLQAAADSRAAIRRAGRLGAGEIAATGCWATLEPQAAAALPGVSRVILNAQKDTILAGFPSLQPSASNLQTFDLEPIDRQPLPGLRQRTRAFVKTQDGCNNACTFCVTTLARGPARSHPLADVLDDIQYARAGGVQEIVLTGVHLGSWGQDIDLPLHHLIESILAETDVPRLRLSSLEPWDLDEDFFSLWENDRLMPHLHLPLQSGSGPVLRRMARKTTPEAFAALLDAARRRIPDVAITTDVIAGFPGETEAEFAESLDFIRRMAFAGGHAFTYSPRPGTAAARMDGQVRPEVRKERNAILRETFEAAALSYRRKFLGHRLSVLWESSAALDESGWQMEGLSGNYLRVTAVTPEPRWNRVDEVELTELAGNGLAGMLTNVV
jgi:threonylcarbamoyladenosine tRNA methylthiotransferase MtaB